MRLLYLQIKISTAVIPGRGDGYKNLRLSYGVCINKLMASQSAVVKLNLELIYTTISSLIN